MDYYNKIAPGYNELYGEEQRKKLEAIKKYLFLKPADKILDVGCGTCISSGFENFTVGIDTSFELLKDNGGINVQGKAEYLPFKDSSFDAVVCITAIHHFNAEKALSEMQRVGKNHFAISVLRKSINFDAIRNMIKEFFPMIKIIVHEKDILFIL